MSTQMILFTQDPDEDITNAPQHYHNFGNTAVRIKTYWTTPIWTNPALLAQSRQLIRTTDSILRKYTLKLDAVPWGKSPALRAPLRRALDKKYPAPHLHLRPILGHTLPSPMVPRLRSFVEDLEEDNRADTADGRVNYNYSIHVPMEGHPSIETLKPRSCHPANRRHPIGGILGSPLSTRLRQSGPAHNIVAFLQRLTTRKAPFRSKSSAARGSRVRSGLAAGANRIRTRGPAAMDSARE